MPDDSVCLQQGNQPSVLPVSPNQLRGLGVGHGAWASVLISLPIDRNTLPLTHRHDQHQHLPITHFVDQTETGGAEDDLGAMAGDSQLAGGIPRFAQPFGQPLWNCSRITALRVCHSRRTTGCEANSSGIKADPQQLLPICQLGGGDAAERKIVHENHWLIAAPGRNAGEGRVVAVADREVHGKTTRPLPNFDALVKLNLRALTAGRIALDNQAANVATPLALTVRVPLEKLKIPPFDPPIFSNSLTVIDASLEVILLPLTTYTPWLNRTRSTPEPP